jgi:hypothetical protein
MTVAASLGPVCVVEVLVDLRGQGTERIGTALKQGPGQAAPIAAGLGLADWHHSQTAHGAIVSHGVAPHLGRLEPGCHVVGILNVRHLRKGGEKAFKCELITRCIVTAVRVTSDRAHTQLKKRRRSLERGPHRRLLREEAVV